MRHVFIIVDTSMSMMDADMKPNRLEAVIAMLKPFLTEFFHQNPISQVGIIATNECKAELIIELSSSTERISAAIDAMAKRVSDRVAAHGAETGMSGLLFFACL